jgi:hypothetical protein
MADLIIEVLSAQFFVSASLLAVVGAAVSGIIIFRNELKRQARREFRFALGRLRERPAAGDWKESELARTLVQAIDSQRYDAVRNFKSDPLVEDYILDLDFKAKLYKRLIEEMTEKNKRLTREQAEILQGSVEEWRGQQLTLGQKIDAELKSASSDGTAKLAIRFLEKKENYFAEKREQLIHDVGSVLRAAATSFPNERQTV